MSHCIIVFIKPCGAPTPDQLYQVETRPNILRKSPQTSRRNHRKIQSTHTHTQKNGEKNQKSPDCFSNKILYQLLKGFVMILVHKAVWKVYLQTMLPD